MYDVHPGGRGAVLPTSLALCVRADNIPGWPLGATSLTKPPMRQGSNGGRPAGETQATVDQTHGVVVSIVRGTDARNARLADRIAGF